MNMAYTAFASALRAPNLEAPVGLFRTWNGSEPGVRLAVYRNNVWSSLVRALGESFPVVQALVGESFFATMAREYVAACPPSSPVLTQYGGAFGAFIAAFPQAAELPYLADVARLEWARIQAYHSADLAPLEVSILAAHAARPEALAGAVLGLHPGVSLLVSPHPVAAIWAAHQGHHDLADIALDQPENALVFRAEDEPVVQTISHAMAAFIGALHQGQTLGEAVAAGAERGPLDAQAFDLTAALGYLILNPLVCSWTSPD